MTDLQHKYKERSPEETVQIIQKFFQDRNYDLRVTNNFQTTACTWTCALDLYKDGIHILHSNGKGMSEIFSLASGHAELYERFCNMSPALRCVTFMDAYMDNSLKKKGYVFCPDEKIISHDEALQIPVVRDFFMNIFKTRENVDEMFNIIFNDKDIIGIPYKRVGDDNDIIYSNPIILDRVNGTTGLSTGNTECEALNQGMSEIYEEICTIRFHSMPCDKYYVLDHSAIQNQELLSKINAIKDAGFDYYIFDLGYNFHLPAVLGVLVDPKGCVCRLNFGSFPVFDIAVERTITEVYQNIKDYYSENSIIELPYKINDPYLTLLMYGNNFSEAPYINEQIFQKIEYVTQCCPEVYISANHSNEEICQHCIALNQQHNFEMYYHNTSRMDEIATIQIFIANQSSDEALKERNLESMSKLLIKPQLKAMRALRQFMINVVHTDFTVNDDRYASLLQEYNNFMDFYWSDERADTFFDLMTFEGWENILAGKPYTLSLFRVVYMEDNFGLQQLPQSYLYPYIKEYYTILQYRNAGYSSEEIQTFMNTTFNKNLSLKYIESIPSQDTLFLHGFLYPTKALYDSDMYQEILDSYLPR